MFVDATCPQRGNADSVELLADSDAKRVDELAAVFGWQRVGWVLSHGVERSMTSREVVQAAAVRRDMGPQAVTLVCLRTFLLLRFLVVVVFFFFSNLCVCMYVSMSLSVCSGGHVTVPL